MRWMLLWTLSYGIYDNPLNFLRWYYYGLWVTAFTITPQFFALILLWTLGYGIYDNKIVRLIWKEQTMTTNKTEKQFLKTIEKYNMLTKGNTVIVGLSGGCDSVCLFTLLHKFKEQLHINIEAVHINHLIREESHLDEKFCVELCNHYNTPLHIYHIDVDKIAQEQKLSSEEAGRLERYKAFNKHCKDDTYKIAIAHNKNDVAETFLMRLFRGSGVQGLKAIPPTRDNIVRPIIEIEREDLETYLTNCNQHYCTDETNFLPIYTRNKVRLSLLPEIKNTYNTNIVSTLYDTSKILEEEDDFVQSIVSEKFKELSDFTTNLHNEKILVLNLEKLLGLHSYLQKLIILKSTSLFIYHNKNVSKKHISSILEILETTGNKTLNLPNNLLVTKSYTTLTFSLENKTSNSPLKKQLTEQILQPNNLVYIEEINKYLYAKPLENTEFSALHTNPTYIDELCDGLITDIYKTKDLKLKVVKHHIFCYYSLYNNVNIKVRSRQNGDKINIKNLGTKKLKDYFIDKKVPADLRDVTPIISVGDEILWVIDFYNQNFNIVNATTSNLNTKDNNVLIILMEA